MKPHLIVAVAFGLIALPIVAKADNPPAVKGKSTFAPGQQTGAAKDYAPGQKRQVQDNKKMPGASEYAPGQQGRTDGPGQSGMAPKKK